jgi:predicted ATPase
MLVALFQGYRNNRSRLPLVGIEEPETALHPAAAGVLRDALLDASTALQVLVTSHSPDLLDSKDVPPESILAVTADDGVTRLGPIDAVGRQVLHDRLFTAGELLRQRQLSPMPRVGKATPLFRRTAA